MVNKCSGFGCKSGYKSNKQVESSGPRLTFHSFPINNKPLCELWIRANPRKDFIPSKHSKLCSLHFRQSDFVEERQDKDTARVKRISKKLIQRYLKDDAVPSIFEICPKYLSTSDSVIVSSSRFEPARELELHEWSNSADDDVPDVKLNPSIGHQQSHSMNSFLTTHPEECIPTQPPTLIDDEHTMVYKCVAYGCRTGYDSSSKLDKQLKAVPTMHGFPSNKELRDQWIEACSRKNFVPTRHSKLCSLHFKSSDFVQKPQDSNKSRMKKKILQGELLRTYLKKNAVPSIFMNTSEIPPRPHNRSHKKILKDGSFEQWVMVNDNIPRLTLTEIVEKLNNSEVPHSFQTSIINDTLLIFMMEIKDDEPQMKSCIITVKSDLSVILSIEGETVADVLYSDLIKGPLEDVSQVIALMARVKAWCKDDRWVSRELNLRMAISCLQNSLAGMDDTDCYERTKIIGMVGELQLMIASKYDMQYLPKIKQEIDFFELITMPDSLMSCSAIEKMDI